MGWFGPEMPSSEQILKAFDNLGTQSSVAVFFGVSRRTVERWTKKLNIQPKRRPEVPITQLISTSLSSPEARTRVAQWIVDEASITVAYNRRFDTTSLMVIGAMYDSKTMELIAQDLDVKVFSGTEPIFSRLPTHVIKVQGPKAYSLLGLLSRELTGLKASEAKAALAFFPVSGLLRGRVTTDLFMESVWKEFAIECVESWNRRRKEKKAPDQLQGMIDAWMHNRVARARRGLTKESQVEVTTVSISATL